MFKEGFWSGARKRWRDIELNWDAFALPFLEFVFIYYYLRPQMSIINCSCEQSVTLILGRRESNLRKGEGLV